MKPNYKVALVVGVAIGAALAAPAFAADLKVISAGAVRGVVGGMIDEYSRQTGHKFQFTVGPTGQKCHPMADAARAELAYYAGARVRTWNPGVEELLSALDARNPSAAGLNGGAPGPQRRDAAAPDCTQADTHWKAADDLKSLAIYEDHLARFPACNFAAVAAARIEQLRKK